MSDRGRRPRLLPATTEDWTVWEIRRDLARIALNAGCEVTVATRVTNHGECIRQEGFHLVSIIMLGESRNPIKELLRVRYQIQTSLGRLWINLWPSVVFSFYLFVQTREETMVSQRFVSGGSR
jgi:hypothetical protein